MRIDSRLSSVLHVLLHMTEHEGPVTSDQLARYLKTNPVVVRRTMGLLRDAKIVGAERGHGGGWRIEADLRSVTLLQLHHALGEPPIFAIGNRNDVTDCLIEQTVNAVLDSSLVQAEALLLAWFGSISLQDLASEFAERRRSRRGDGQAPCHRM